MSKSSRFATDRSGSVAVLFSLAAVPAFALIGLALDYHDSVRQRARLQSTVDAAALAAGLDLSGANDAQRKAKANAAVATALGGDPSLIIRNVDLKTVDGNFVVTIDAASRTKFGGWFGVSAINETVRAAVPKRVGTKMDVEFLLDASASMGLAADAAGRDKLYKAVGCAFACHMLDPGQKETNLHAAQRLGIQTRLDVLKSAVGAMIGRLAASKGPLDTYRVAIDTFDDLPNRAVPITTNLASAQTYIQNYQLANNTSFSNAMPFFNGDVGTQGDGQSGPKKFAIVVTDGVQGRRDRVGGFHPFDSKLCDTMKGQGVTLMVLNTRYVPMPAEQAYRDTVMPIQNLLEPALQACASPGYYFSATDQAEINDAFGKMFNSMQASLKLVQ